MEKVRGEEFRTTLICIDDYRDGVPSGRFYNHAQKEGKFFRGIMELLSEMEWVMEQMEFPKAYHAVRTFADIPDSSTVPPLGQNRTGKHATFSLRILFRQNASWQGSVTWMEGKKMQSFRSVLELVLLMNSALAA